MNKGRTCVLTLDTTLVTVDDDGLQELVGLVLLVALLDSLDDILALLALTLDKALDSDLDALPTLVTVHRVVAADDSRDLAVLLLLEELEQVLRVAGSRAGRGVATVTEEVDENVWDALLLGGLKESLEVVDVRVDTTVGDLEIGKFSTQVPALSMRMIRTRPRKWRRPLVSFACLQLARITSFLWKVRFLMETSMRTMSCQTMRPAPIFKCLHIVIRLQ